MKIIDMRTERQPDGDLKMIVNYDIADDIGHLQRLLRERKIGIITNIGPENSTLVIAPKTEGSGHGSKQVN